MLFDINSINTFSTLFSSARMTKAKVNKWCYIKLKSFCIVKEIISEINRQLTDWGKIFTSDTSDKGLIFKIYKEQEQLNIRK